MVDFNVSRVIALPWYTLFIARFMIREDIVESWVEILET